MQGVWWGFENFPKLMEILGSTGQIIFCLLVAIGFFIGITEEEDEETQARKRREAYRRGE